MKIILFLFLLTAASADLVPLGAGHYRTDLPPGPDGKPRRSIEPAPLVSQNVTGPIPTNDWWSSLVWPAPSPHSMAMFPHPLAVQAQTDGLGIGYTNTPTITDHKKDDKTFQVGSDYRFPYRESLRVGLEGMETETTVLDSYSDWAVTALWKQEIDELRATFAHGSPFVFFEKESDRPVTIKFTATKIDATREPVDPHVVEWQDITAKHNGQAGAFELSINAGSHVGIGSKARLSYDFDGDGKTDRTETFHLFATDPVESTWENYTSEKQKAEIRGNLADFKNGSIRFEYWKCFGKGGVTLDAATSKLTLPDRSERKVGANKITTGEKPPSAVKIFHDGGHVLGVTVNGSHFGIFAPSGTDLRIQEATLRSNLNGHDYLSIAALPDSSPSTIEHFQRHAYAFLRDTRITYDYEPTTASVTTTFTAVTEAKAGTNTDTIFALYRHQHLHVTEPQRFEKYTYASPRGEMRTLTGNTFSTIIPYFGVLPALPNSPGTKLGPEVAALEFSKEDTYWNGKEFGKICELIQIAEQLGDTANRDHLLSLLKRRLEDWFDGKEKYFFYRDERWDTLVGYPDSYGSGDQLNDHHFHYSYFIRAAATIAQFDRDWVQPERYGKMIDALIRNCASADRNDSEFPWMRSFDPYAGHSWAAGHAGFASGNNQESSSESMNFATALILYGQAIGNQEIRDLGIYWHSTEAEAIRHYWFDQDGEVFPEGYQQSCVGMVWGDGGAYGTWWTANPEEIHGINFLPINGGSLYLGRDPDYVQANLANLKKANHSFHTNGFKGDPNAYNRWQDILAEYLALADPIAAKALLAKVDKSELGETLTHSRQWIGALETLGHVDPETRANHPTAVAFKNAYVTYNPSTEPITIKFTNGKAIQAAPGLTNTPR